MSRTRRGKSSTAVRAIAFAIIGACIVAIVLGRYYARPTSIDVAGTTIPLPTDLRVVAWEMPLLSDSEYRYVVERIRANEAVPLRKNVSRFAVTSGQTDGLPRERSVPCRRLSFFDSFTASAGTCKVYALTTKSAGWVDVLVAVDDLPCGSTFEYWGTIDDFHHFSSLMAGSINACARAPER